MKDLLRVLDYTLDVGGQGVRGVSITIDRFPQCRSVFLQLVPLLIKQLLDLVRRDVDAGLKGVLLETSAGTDNIDLITALEPFMRKTDDIQRLPVSP